MLTIPTAVFAIALPAVLAPLLASPWMSGVLLNTLLAGVAIVAPKKLLTPAGLVHAWALGVAIWATLGWQGYGVIMFYFLVGSAVTRIGMAQKEAAGIAEKRSGARGPENVWGSALTAMLCAIAIWALRWSNAAAAEYWIPLLVVGYVASLSTKLSDTSASEVGKAYGKRTFLITTLRPGPAGTEGAVSLEGTIAGVVASIVLALLAWALGLVTLTGVVVCAIAALIATTVESVIGATIQEQFQWLTNEVVNIINTLVGAGSAIAITAGLMALWA